MENLWLFRGHLLHPEMIRVNPIRFAVRDRRGGRAPASDATSGCRNGQQPTSQGIRIALGFQLYAVAPLGRRERRWNRRTIANGSADLDQNAVMRTPASATRHNATLRRDGRLNCRPHQPATTQFGSHSQETTTSRAPRPIASLYCRASFRSSQLYWGGTPPWPMAGTLTGPSEHPTANGGRLP